MLQVVRTITPLQQQASALTRVQARTYRSRAHPTKLPEYPIAAALEMVLEDAKSRSVKRAEKWERNKPVRVKKGIQVRATMLV
jgi:hypothetical protein